MGTPACGAVRGGSGQCWHQGHGALGGIVTTGVSLGVAVTGVPRLSRSAGVQPWEFRGCCFSRDDGTGEVSHPMGTSTAARSATRWVSPPIPPSALAGDLRCTSTLHTCEMPDLRLQGGTAPRADAKADCSGVFTRARIKGSLTPWGVTSEQGSHSYFYAIKSAGDLPSAFPCFVPSPAHLSL